MVLLISDDLNGHERRASYAAVREVIDLRSKGKPTALSALAAVLDPD